METLREYTKRRDALTMTAIAKGAGVTVSRLSQLRDSRNWPPMLALSAEKQTGGVLDAAFLSPVVSAARAARAGADSDVAANA